VKGDRII